MAGEYKKIVIVTGGSSGIGRCTASALRDSGCIVYEFSRRNIPMEGITHMSVDVTDENAVNSAVKQIIQKETKMRLSTVQALEFLVQSNLRQPIRQKLSLM